MGQLGFYFSLFLWSTIVYATNCAAIPPPVACVPNTSVCTTSQSDQPPTLKGFGSARHAVIIGIDGLGGVYLKNCTKNYTTLSSFFDLGAHTFQARAVYPMSSGPNWATYLTGMGPMEHGILTNTWGIENGSPLDETTYSIPPISGRGLPSTIFSQVKSNNQNLTTGMFFTWQWLKYFSVNNSDINEWFWASDEIDICNLIGHIECYNIRDTNVVSRTSEFIRKNLPTLTFVHLDALDVTGHATCYGCPKYYETLKVIDQQVKVILDTLNETTGTSGKPMLDDTFVVIVSDHGGWQNTHKFKLPFHAVVDIPILIRGPGVGKNQSLDDVYVSSLDVPMTVLHALGVDKNKFMRGRVLNEIYN